ncbi:tail tape measure protein [Xanthomonas phage JGB6]|nr:tail tape measure protein [Xanthomonas phage JGB6]
MDDIWANAMDGMADSFVDFALEGKNTFGDLCKSILKDVMKLLASKAIAQLASMVVGMFGGGGGAYTGVSSGAGSMQNFGGNIGNFTTLKRVT